MADISKIVLDGVTYNIKDETARAKLFPVTWYLPSGIASSNVVAAYKFVGASSEDAALTNVVNSSNYKLTKINNGNEIVAFSNDFWNASTGVLLQCSQALTNSSLAALTTIKSAVFGYRYTEEINTSKSSVGTSMKKILYTNGWQGSSNYLKCAIGQNVTDTYLYKSAIEYDRGVIGGNFTSTSSYNVFLNGMNVPLTTYSVKINLSNQNTDIAIGQNGNRGSANVIPAYVTALVFYNVTLSASQHMELYNNIVALGGGLD